VETIEIPTKTIEIPTEEQAASEARMLILKLLLCPTEFTVVEMGRLKQIMRAEGYLD